MKWKRPLGIIVLVLMVEIGMVYGYHVFQTTVPLAKMSAQPTSPHAKKNSATPAISSAPRTWGEGESKPVDQDAVALAEGPPSNLEPPLTDKDGGLTTPVVHLPPPVLKPTPVQNDHFKNLIAQEIKNQHEKTVQDLQKLAAVDKLEPVAPPAPDLPKPPAIGPSSPEPVPMTPVRMPTQPEEITPTVKVEPGKPLDPPTPNPLFQTDEKVPPPPGVTANPKPSELSPSTPVPIEKKQITPAVPAVPSFDPAPPVSATPLTPPGSPTGPVPPPGPINPVPATSPVPTPRPGPESNPVTPVGIKVGAPNLVQVPSPVPTPPPAVEPSPVPPAGIKPAAPDPLPGTWAPAANTFKANPESEKEVVKVVNSPWTLTVEVVDGKTILTARTSKEAQFRVTCAKLDLHAPRGTMKAEGGVKISGNGLEGSCDFLAINLQEDLMMLEGKVQVKCQRGQRELEMKADRFSLRLSETTGPVTGAASSNPNSEIQQVKGNSSSPQASNPKPPGPPAGSKKLFKAYTLATYYCRAGDTSTSVSRNLYGTEKFARALLLFNRDYQNQESWTFAPGLPVYYPPKELLEYSYPESLTSRPSSPQASESTYRLVP